MELADMSEDALIEEGEQESGDESQGLTRSYTRVERDAVERILDVVEERASRLSAEGLSTSHFFLGVANTFLICGICFGYPQHAWLLWAAEATVLFPLRGYCFWAAQPLRESYYMFDFCWIANFTGAIVMLLCVVDKVAYPGEEVISDRVREKLFCIVWTFACGPLAGAVALLGNALIFHSPLHWVSLCIHLFPTLVLYTMRHEADAVTAAWPHVFALDYFKDVSAAMLIGYGTAFYGAWLLLFTGWMVTAGIKLPGRGYDTVFHNMMRKSPTLMRLRYEEEDRKRRAEENDWQAVDVLLYLSFHAAACVLGIVFLSIPCFFYKRVHAVVNCALICAAVWNGAQRYSFYLLESYALIVRKELEGYEKNE